MRILRTTLLGLLGVGLLGIQQSADAQSLVTSVSIQDVSTEFNGSFDAGNTIDQSGLTGAGAFGAGTHSEAGASGIAWVTSSAGGSTGSITFDLVGDYDLSGIHVWNNNEIGGGGPGGNTTRGAMDVTISVATVAAGPFTVLDNAGGDFLFPQADGMSNYAGFGVGLGGVTNASLLDEVRYVRFDISSNYGNALLGLAEVQFEGVQVNVPADPSLFTWGGPGVLRDNFTGIIGGEFLTGSEATEVTKLGFYDDGEDGFAIDHDVAIWDVRTQMVVAQGMLSAGTGDELIGAFRYVTLGTAVTLEPYSEYRLVATTLSGSGDPFNEKVDGAFPDVSNLPSLNSAFDEYVFGVGRFLTPGTISDFPTSTAGTSSTAFIGANFIGTIPAPLSGLAAASSIPEPTSGLLFVSGLAIAGLWNRRNRLAAGARVGTLGAALVIMLLMSPTAMATHGGSTPAGFVDAGSAFTAGNSTAALQALFDTGDDIFVPDMGADWVLGQMFLNQDNQDILFEDGVVVQGLAGAFTGSTNDSLFQVDRVANGSLTGYGATFSMAAVPVIGGFESRHGIRLHNVVDYDIAGLRIERTQGDGIYVGSTTTIGINKDVTIQDVVIDDVFRNGISVISVRGLLIDNSVIINTGFTDGTNPQAGIDFEPNFSTQRIVDVTVRNTIFAGNGNDGIVFAVVEDLEPEPISVLIDNVTLYDNGRFGITLDSEALPNVVIRDTLVVNNDDGGFRVTGATSQAIEYSALTGNGAGGVMNFVNSATPGTGTITNDGALGTPMVSAPVFLNTTDPTDPLYFVLDPSTSTLISLGDSDGSFIGARGVAGDFDADAGIDGFDFLAWQRGESPNNGSTGDLAAWEQFFGEVGAPLSGLAAGVGAVPEPSSSLLLFMGVGLGSLLLRRKRLGS